MTFQVKLKFQFDLKIQLWLIEIPLLSTKILL